MNDLHNMFPNGIRALIVESDARFLRSASLMLSLLNYRVSTCDTPASAVGLLSGRLKRTDVVFIDALRAATCGFDFRGTVESHLCIPVIYFLSRDYGVGRDMAEAVQHTVRAATHVIMKPLNADAISELWGLIQWAKFMLRRGESTTWSRGNNRGLLPATVQALLPSSSTVHENQQGEEDGREHFRVVRPGRGRPMRNLLGARHDGGSSGRGRGRGRVASSLDIGHQATRTLEQMNGTQEQESDNDDDDNNVIPSYQQPGQQNRQGIQAMGVQNQQHGRSLFMQPVVLQMMLNVPRNSPMISADAAGPSSSNVAAFAGASNTSAPALPPLPYQALARATSPAAPGLPPPVYLQPQTPVALARAGRGRRRRLDDDSHDGGSSSRSRIAAYPFTVGGQPTGRQEQMNLAEGQESDDDDVVPRLQQQQPAQQNQQGVQAMDVQNQQHGRSLFVPFPQMLNLPLNNPSMISADAAGPSRSNATAFAGPSNISAPALLPALGLPPVHQQQQSMPLYDFGKMAATRGHEPPQFARNQQQQLDMFAPCRQGGWIGLRRETTPIMLSFQQPPAADPFMAMAGGAGDTTFGALPTGAPDAGLQSLSTGAQYEPADSFDDVLRRAMMEMKGKFPRTNYGNCSAEALMGMAPPATDELAATVSSNRSNYNARLFMVTDVDGSKSESFMAPQDLAVPTGSQVELGAPDIYGSLSQLGSPGRPSAMFDGNGNMSETFPSDQYDENAMLSVDALWDFDEDVPMHPDGQQVAAADSTTSTNATGIMSNGGASGGLGPNWNMGAGDNGLDIMEELLRKDNADGFHLPQDMNNGHQ